MSHIHAFTHAYLGILKLVSTDAPSWSRCENYFVYVDGSGARNLRFFLFMISLFSFWKHILEHLIHTEICAYK